MRVLADHEHEIELVELDGRFLVDAEVDRLGEAVAVVLVRAGLLAPAQLRVLVVVAAAAVFLSLVIVVADDVVVLIFVVVVVVVLFKVPQAVLFVLEHNLLHVVLQTVVVSQVGAAVDRVLLARC